MNEDRQGPAPEVPETARRGADIQGRNPPDLSWVEASIWTERMVSALVNGVKGGCWFSLALDQRLLRGRRAVRASHGLAGREMLPMRKPPTGEPCAGKPHARFGGRGGDAVPTPIDVENAAELNRTAVRQARL